MSTPARVAIVGGGVAGLATAWYLQKRGLPYTVLERDARWGGKVFTERAEGYIIEAAPDSFLTRKPWAYDLARDLGLDDEIIGVQKSRYSIYVLVNGKPVPMPEGLRLLVPTKLGPFLRSPLFTPWGKLRLLADLIIPAKNDGEDESLAEFITRRMGPEALDRLAEPLLAGVYNAEADKQSILATFRQFRALEEQHGGMIRGMWARAKQTPPSDTPAFVSFKRGTHTLVEGLVEKLTGDLRLNTPVTVIGASENGYTLTLENGDTLGAEVVVIATQADHAAGIIREAAPQAADKLRDIRYAGVGVVTVAFHRADVPHPLDAMGLVIPSSEGRSIDGMTWATTKWTHRAPTTEDVLMRVFFGGPHTRAMLDADDADLVRKVRDELQRILGITAEPKLTRITRWRSGYPQYDVGHIERVAGIMDALPPGLHLVGNAYGGVGVPDTVHGAKQTAEKINLKVTV